MNHISEEQWKTYVQDEIDLSTRRQYEEHLYRCDQCLELYLHAVTAYGEELPDVTDSAAFTGQVLEKVKEQPKGTRAEAARPFYQRTIVHYTVAAAITVLFMASGLFQSLTTIQSPAFTESSSSVTEQLVNKTVGWLNVIEQKSREENDQ
ncbi:hypothetical protein M3212_07760 [Alkalihalobacillus oceani]|uniref:hypothetical protein n=1 Tax=Halalkalibacter oceani TaxID=1653776 RepID=UPI00203CAE9C|nr:hypothetical protein [Halalkalibacter oceani]MCM3760682.1 hypothetical protein [Halalkalibacter oceani]